MAKVPRQETESEADIPRRIADQLDYHADQLEKSTADFLQPCTCQHIGATIYLAWLNDLLTSSETIHREIGWVVDNPPSADNRLEQARWRAASGMRKRTQKELLQSGIFYSVFNQQHELGAIDVGRVGGVQLCRKLAAVARSKQLDSMSMAIAPPAIKLKDNQLAIIETLRTAGRPLKTEQFLSALNDHGLPSSSATKTQFAFLAQIGELVKTDDGYSLPEWQS